jgi:hypothetical protein
MSKFHLLSCPLQPNYHFYNKCTIACLYNTSKCKFNCMQLGTSQLASCKTLSVSEILFYKSDVIENPSIRTINSLKKEYTTRIQNLYAFNFYLDFVRNYHFDVRLTLCSLDLSSILKSSRITNILNRYPYNIDLFKLSVEDLILLFTDSYFEEFKIKKKLNVETTYLDILCITDQKIQKARKVLLKYLTKKGVSHEFCKEEDQSITVNQD